MSTLRYRSVQCLPWTQTSCSVECDVRYLDLLGCGGTLTPETWWYDLTRVASNYQNSLALAGAPIQMSHRLWGSRWSGEVFQELRGGRHSSADALGHHRQADSTS